MLHEYGAVHRVRFEYDFETRGPDHQREFRASVHLTNDERAKLTGTWART